MRKIIRIIVFILIFYCSSMSWAQNRMIQGKIFVVSDSGLTYKPKELPRPNLCVKLFYFTENNEVLYCPGKFHVTDNWEFNVVFQEFCNTPEFYEKKLFVKPFFEYGLPVGWKLKQPPPFILLRESQTHYSPSEPIILIIPSKIRKKEREENFKKAKRVFVESPAQSTLYFYAASQGFEKYFASKSAQFLYKKGYPYYANEVIKGKSDVKPYRLVEDVFGTICGKDHLPLPGAVVQLSGENIHKRTTVSNEKGDFIFKDIPTGDYRLDIKLEGCSTYTKVLHVGTGTTRDMSVTFHSAEIKTKMDISRETPVPVSQPPLLDPGITKGQIFFIQKVRNPFEILQHLPMLNGDKMNLAANESGQQNEWFVDSSCIDYLFEIGVEPLFYEFNYLADLNRNIGKNNIFDKVGDFSVHNLSDNLNNNLRGELYFILDNRVLGLQQHLPTQISDKGWDSPAISERYQYGLSLGGPIIKDKLLFWIGGSVNDKQAKTIIKNDDTNWIGAIQAKTAIHLPNFMTNLIYLYTHDNGSGKTPLGPASQAADTYWDKDGDSHVMTADIIGSFGSNLMIDAQFLYDDTQNTLNPAGSTMSSTTDHLEGADWWEYYFPQKYISGSLDYQYRHKRNFKGSLKFTYFHDQNVLGATHEARLKIQHLTSSLFALNAFPNQRRLFIYDKDNPLSEKEIWWTTDGKYDLGYKQFNIALFHTMTWLKLAVNLELWYLWESGFHHATSLPGLTLDGESIFTQYLGQLTTAERDIDKTISNLIGCVSAVYDFNGEGNTIAKIKYEWNNYGHNYDLPLFLWQGGPREIHVPWDDFNHNLKPEKGEFSENKEDWLFWQGFDYLNPYSSQSTNKYDDQFGPIKSDLFYFDIEQTLAENILIGLEFTYQQLSSLPWTRGYFTNSNSLDSAENWYNAGSYTFTNGTSKDFYRINEKANALYQSNYGNDTYISNTSWGLFLKKKLLHHWMLYVFFKYSVLKLHLNPDEVFDMTNFDYYDQGIGLGLFEKQLAKFSSPNSRWDLHVVGSWNLPWDITFSGQLRFVEGWVIPYHETFYRSDLGWTRIYPADEKMGDHRLPNILTINLRLQKSFRLFKLSSLVLFVNGYNVTNSNATLEVNPALGSSATGNILNIAPPATFQLGLTFKF